MSDKKEEKKKKRKTFFSWLGKKKKKSDKIADTRGIIQRHTDRLNETLNY